MPIFSGRPAFFGLVERSIENPQNFVNPGDIRYPITVPIKLFPSNTFDKFARFNPFNKIA